MTAAKDKWTEQEAGLDCYLCPPRLSAHPGIILVACLSASSLFLQRDQRFRGHCCLILAEHVTRLDALPEKTYFAFMQDLRRSVSAIREAANPDHMNIALLGNSCPHLHWSIVPRSRRDSRWGRPVWEDSILLEMKNNPAVLTDAEYGDLIGNIRKHF